MASSEEVAAEAEQQRQQILAEERERQRKLADKVENERDRGSRDER